LTIKVLEILKEAPNQHVRMLAINIAAGVLYSEPRDIYVQTAAHLFRRKNIICGNLLLCKAPS
jgi:hypothetical protein